MSRQPDRMSILKKLRPVTSVDTVWPASARDAALARVLAAGTTDALDGRSRPRRRRVLLTAAVAAGVVAGATGAAAGGLLPRPLTDALSFWSSETEGEVDPRSGRRIAQGPGPGNTVLSVWSARGKDGEVCMSVLFEPPGELDRPPPKNFRSTGGSCQKPDRGPTPFAFTGGSSDDEGVHMMMTSAGPAVRAELRLPDGTTRPAVYAEGMFFVWYLANDGIEPPNLIGYDAAGQVLAEVPMPKLGRPPR